MKKEEIISKIESKEVSYIYGYSYGFKCCFNSDKVYADIVEKINLDEMKLKDFGFYYIWGGPGPDCNIYDFESYGKTWAFSIEEFEPNPYPQWEYWMKNKKCRYIKEKNILLWED